MHQFLAPLVGLIRAVPQLVRLLRAREAVGVSIDTAATSSIVGFGWALYGVLTHQIYVSLATASLDLIFALIAFLPCALGEASKNLELPRSGL